jgi:putative phosphoesterase
MALAPFFRHARPERALVLSDIHGNLAALEAVAAAERYDAVICLGDIVGYGPEPAACVRWIRDRAPVVVQGNHDRAFAERVGPGCREQFRWLAEATAPVAHTQLAASDLGYLAALPRWAYLELSGIRYLFVHATPRDPLYQYLDPEPEAWEAAVIGIDADVVVVGHTHVQFDIPAGERRVVNPGSVGQPKDGDPRAAYAVIEGGAISLRRVSYPVDRTVDALRRAGVIAPAVRDLATLLRTGRVPVPRNPIGAEAERRVLDAGQPEPPRP